MPLESIKEWYIHYINNRNIILKKIDNLDDSQDNIIISYKDGSRETAVIIKDITSIYAIIKELKAIEKITIVILNKKNHINIMIKEWEKLLNYKKLTIMFVNQNSTNEKKWMIKPFIHDRITEKPALRSGIISLANNVDPC